MSSLLSLLMQLWRCPRTCCCTVAHEARFSLLTFSLRTNSLQEAMVLRMLRSPRVVAVLLASDRSPKAARPRDGSLEGISVTKRITGAPGIVVRAGSGMDDQTFLSPPAATTADTLPETALALPARAPRASYMRVAASALTRRHIVDKDESSRGGGTGDPSNEEHLPAANHLAVCAYQNGRMPGAVTTFGNSMANPPGDVELDVPPVDDAVANTVAESAATPALVPRHAPDEDGEDGDDAGAGEQQTTSLCAEQHACSNCSTCEQPDGSTSSPADPHTPQVLTAARWASFRAKLLQAVPRVAHRVCCCCSLHAHGRPTHRHAKGRPHCTPRRAWELASCTLLGVVVVAIFATPAVLLQDSDSTFNGLPRLQVCAGINWNCTC